MKILLTSDWYRPTINGVVTSVLNLAQGLREMGHEVRILTLSHNRHSHQTEFVTYIGSMGIGKIYPGARLKTSFTHRRLRSLIEWKPDIVHSQCEFSTFFIAHHIARACGAPLVHTYHTVYEDYTHYFSPNARIGRFMAEEFSRVILGRTDAVIAPSAKVKELLSSYDVRKPIFTVPSGLLLERFQTPLPAWERTALRQKLGIAADDRVLICIGRLAQEKNIDELLNMMRTLSGKNIRLLLVGDGPYRSQLEARAQALKLQDRVVFAGMVPPDQIGHYYQLGDVFVSASQSETQGLTYIEAMASGLPMLCRHDSCLDDVIRPGVNGYEYASAQEFLHMARELLENPERAAAMGSAARMSVQSVFSHTAFARSVSEIYSELLAQPVPVEAMQLAARE